MFIQRVIIENYRCLKSANVSLNEKLNVIVGNNECGKSTLLEAIHLAMTGQLNGRPLLVELHPYLFNLDLVEAYIEALEKGTSPEPPRIVIEVYLADDPTLTKLKGDNNSLGLDQPGVSLVIELNPAHAEDFAQYVSEPSEIRTLPVEYYWIKWRDFAENEIINARGIPLQTSLIDASTIRNNAAASRYVVDIVKESLSPKEKVDLALSYRLMKDRFLEQPKVKTINDALATKKGGISDKVISVSLDTSARANWEAGIMPHLDDIPLPLVGKGEQNSVKIKLAMETSAKSHIILIEEAENHLSYASLSELIGHISANAGSRQIFITTHSSFVLNKLGVESVLLFQRGEGIRLTDLKDKSTQDYFMKLPGHDTLRLILAKRSILVEGPSDELIVQRAYEKRHGKAPLEDGVDVISVNSLAFKRFLEIAVLLKKTADVVMDNDGSVSALKTKYADYLGSAIVTIQYDDDESLNTLEPQLLAKNGLATVNSVLGQSFSNDAAALAYMASHKADTALRFFETSVDWSPPDYIARAVR
ncbi:MULTISPECIES: AAA family ATPase [unclassified Brucella]|uniref:ATP-dependent nuclease n=1 Tax=unclassified Brucella TaxID=2632610 RepID=UPI000972846E|nr:AAA family ATPase [Brucella sp. 09RB8471]APX68959.1 ATP-dependent endonuclease [Brucella sp. 09RB8471]MRN77862.1 AAA family ATPase [Brucella sp. 10RB9210]